MKKRGMTSCITKGWGIAKTMEERERKEEESEGGGIGRVMQ